ncbi:hypothetical protein WA026_006615 [Henosepilachna vigintioctopunctata]|uniref:Uncharacterized protein n=1 Tax=Henosepilachna vigintioctopunctata TaxID=420089 RepID=A0AAW1UHD2_9CUCU
MSGLYANYGNFQIFIKDINPDVVLLSETVPKNTHKVNIKNCTRLKRQKLRQDREENEQGIANNIIYKTVNLICNDISERNQIQCEQIVNFSIIHVYCPPNVMLTVIFMEEISQKVDNSFILQKSPECLKYVVGIWDR